MNSSRNARNERSSWKTAAGLIGSIAALITALAALIPVLRSDAGTPNPGPATGEVSTAALIRDAERLASRWVDALQNRETDTLVGMAEPPFYMDSDIRVSRADVRGRYTEMLGDAAPQFVVTRLDARTVGDFRSAGLLDQRDRVLSSMRIEDDDIAVGVFVGDEAIILFFRRIGDELEMAGFWD